MLNYGRHFIDKKDILNVNNILKSNSLTQGIMSIKFENRLKKYLDSKYCTVVSNGTAALYLLAKALNWKKGDYILTTTNSFVATSNCIVSTGAKPEFVDIDLDTGNISTIDLLKKIIKLKQKKKNIKAIIAIDYGGCPSDWPKLRFIAKKYNIELINDSCHSLGSSIYNNHAYALKYADYATYSFHPVKPITTGEGGAIITNKKKIDQKLKILRTHGIIKNEKKLIWHQDMKIFGYNYRLTDFQCALGISQLSKLKKFNLKRNKIAELYKQKFKDNINIKTQLIPNNFKSSYHLFPVRINFIKIKKNKNLFFKKMIKLGIKLQVHYIPIYRHSFYKKKFKINFKNFPNTERFYQEVVSLPIFYDLKKKNSIKINKKYKKYFIKIIKYQIHEKNFNFF